jgi:hypothetical protein
MSQVQNDPIITLPTLNINGLIVSLDATTPNTKLNISAGTARDTNNVMDITLGIANENLEGSTVAAPLVVDTGVVGANGIDTGVLVASKVYAVYVIADSRYYQPVAGLVSLASNSTPTMPFGYDSYRLIGYAVTDSSVHFLPAYIYGNGPTRIFRFDAPQATAITAGNATTYTAANLITLVPNIDNLPVAINYSFTPGAAGRALNLTPGNGTGNAITITGQVTSVVVSGQAEVFAQPTTISLVSSPTVDYKVANSGDAVALNVGGFTFSV